MAKAATDYDHLFKIVLIGDSGVGKSCLLLRFADDQFTDSYITTIGVDFRFRTINVDGHVIKLQIWDTAGQERFRTITPAYYRSAMGVILVYDITKRETFDNIKFWMKNLEEYADRSVQKIIIGNKCDLESERAVSKQEGEELAAYHSVPFFETSAKGNINVPAAFHNIANLVRVQRFPAGDVHAPHGQGGVALEAEGGNANKPKKGCC
eukprot:GDKI01031778.1.p1 GENE.GDKI01031778.1~~GDKI01031778.1.p1  ORF type:complete len:209 (-),score=67.19 GDKI01031778.1:30-656(-)